MTCWQPPVRDYEKRLNVSKAMTHVSMGALLLRHVATHDHSQTGSYLSHGLARFAPNR